MELGSTAEADGGHASPPRSAARGRVVLFTGVKPKNKWLPLAILTVGSALQAAGFEVTAIDPQIHDNWRERLSASVPGSIYLGVTCLTGPGIANVLEALEIARAADPSVPIVWGGYHASLVYEGILTEHLADAVVVGQGEAAAVSIAEVVASHGKHGLLDPRLAIPNTAMLRANGDGVTEQQISFTFQPRREPLDDLPPIDYGILEPTAYYWGDVRSIPYITSYGCPYACTYCSEPIMSGRRWNALSVERVIDDAERIQRDYAPDVIDFMDPNLSSNPKRVSELCSVAIERATGAQFMCNMRARDIVMVGRLMPIERLREAGFFRIFIGVESGSDRMLTELDKKSTVSDTVEACQLLDHAGIEFMTSFMHDLPGETADDSQQTLELAASLAVYSGNHQSHHFFTPFPGTDIYQRYFAKMFDSRLPQREWAKNGTKTGTLWQGDPDRRRRVLESLDRVRDRHPHAFRLKPMPELAHTLPAGP